jgi:1,2-diacylglycerol 3-alpha-glucosyltransferase
MKILISNLILYTSESREVASVTSIKDTMIYDLCLGFKALGHEVVLAACDEFKPVSDEEYPFEIKWMPAKLKKVFPVHALPFCPQLGQIAKEGSFDLIITSDVFSLASLQLVTSAGKNLIVWQELAKHNRIFGGLASRIWYGIIARLFFRKVLIVPRSVEAKEFISHYCPRVCDTIVDHGVNLDKFAARTDKESSFAVSSQLIARKHIEKIIDAFDGYLKKYSPDSVLYIMGEGDERDRLEKQTRELGIQSSVIFTGKLAHDTLKDYLQKSAAMLVYTEKDNNMVSIVESIACATPVITTGVPYNASYIRSEKLGIVSDSWGADELNEIATNKEYINNCMKYREQLSTRHKARIFIDLNQG